MWILSQQGFYSVVSKPWNRDQETLTIRSRVRSDLESLSDYLPDMGSIIESTDSDYRFRTVAAQQATANAIAKLVAQIDYDNFKAQIGIESRQRASIYGNVWANLLKLETL